MLLRRRGRIGHAFRLGPNVAPGGGTFDADLTGWSAPAGGWTWSGGKALLTGNGTAQDLIAAGIVTAGKTYLVEYDVDANGDIGAQLGATGGALVNWGATGRVRGIMLSGATSIWFKRRVGTVTGTLDNVSIREVTRT